MIYEFTTTSNPPIRLVGGKAKGLIESTQAGFPVPEGVVLSVDFFQPWLADIKSTQEWQVFLQDGNRQNCDQIAKKISGLPFTTQQRSELSRSMAALPGEVFSIRSSSPEEDLEGASFAGMYQTFLGVSRNKIEGLVRKTFASCFDFRVMSYKSKNNISLEKTSIAVVIQRQIQSEVSGVAFSLNPLNNAYDEVVINASYGLGEAIVSGLVTPDTYIVDKTSLEIIEKSVNKKEMEFRLASDGGISKMAVASPDSQALTEEQILELSDLVCRVEAVNGNPTDTEWAIESGKLYLLQARPITTHIPLFPEMLTERGESKELYMDFLLVTQGFSEPMSDLGIDIWAKMVHIGNGLPRGKGGILWAIHGRHYMCMSHLMRVSPTMLKTFSSHDEPTKRVFENLDKSQFTLGKTPKKLRGFLWKTVKHMMPMYAGSVLKGLFSSRAALADYEEVSARVWDFLHDHIDGSGKPLADLVDESLEGFGELVKEIGGVLIAANIAKWKIERMFKKHAEAKDLIVSLAMNLPNNPVADMAAMMQNVAASPEFIATSTAKDFASRITNRGYSDAFQSLYSDYISKYGSRCAKEIDIATPRVSENIEHVFRALKQIDLQDNASLSVKQRSEAAYNVLSQIAQSMGKQDRFAKLAKTYKDLIGYRDHPKYMYVVAVGLLRKKALKLGEQWAREGRLESPQQVFRLSVDQIARAEKDCDMPVMPLVQGNIAPYKIVEHIKDWPRIIDSRGKIYRAYASAKDGELAGEAISPGVVKGRAKVLMSPYEKPIGKGEILVCKASEPSWAPVFINASGIVMEVGGPLQHGAIIAREYGLPCVSSVFAATKTIKDGDMIEVDGSNGVVKLAAD